MSEEILKVLKEYDDAETAYETIANESNMQVGYDECLATTVERCELATLDAIRLLRVLAETKQ